MANAKKTSKDNKVYVVAKIPENDYKKLVELKAETGYSIADLIRAGVRNICEKKS